MKALGLFLLAFSLLPLASADDRNEIAKRLDEAATVFQEITSAPDKGIPNELLERAECLVIVPGMKRAGFIVGGRYGKGFMTCRNASRAGWSAPSNIRVEGGSFGAQIGAGETDVVLVVMNKSGAEKLMGSEFTLGAGAAAMAGPVGRQASAKTDAYLRAEILSYSRARGLFAGVTLEGATLRSDDTDNEALYGRALKHREILTGNVQMPDVANRLNAALSKYKFNDSEAARSKNRRSSLDIPRSTAAQAAVQSPEMPASSPAGRDVLELNDGRVITGKVVATNNNSVRFRGDDGQTVVYPRSQVKQLTFGTGR